MLGDEDEDVDAGEEKRISRRIEGLLIDFFLSSVLALRSGHLQSGLNQGQDLLSKEALLPSAKLRELGDESSESIPGLLHRPLRPQRCKVWNAAAR